MSFQAMAWAVGQKLPTKEKFLLIMLANYADAEGKCWPSYATLAEETGMARSTVAATLKALEDSGMLSVRQRFDAEKGQQSNMYELKVGFKPIQEEGVRITDGGGPPHGPNTIIEPISIQNPSDSGSAAEGKAELKAFWDEAVGMLMALGLAEVTAKSFTGRCLKLARGNTPEIIRAIEAAVENAPSNPIPYIVAIIGGKAKSNAAKKRQEWNDALEQFANSPEVTQGSDHTDHGLLPTIDDQGPQDLFGDGGSSPSQVPPNGAGSTSKPKRGYLSQV